jgi:hypothetical protein
VISSRVLKVAGLAIGVAMIPSSALAVNVSANDGYGWQARTASYANGAAVSGWLKSTSAKVVYYSGKVAISNCSDSDTGRYSSNTSSTDAVTRGGTITTGWFISWPCGFQGVKSRVCTAKTGIPDWCGSDSATY